MSEQAPKGFYVCQPKPPQPDGRIYAIGGLPWGARFDGLTKEEAEGFCEALRNHSAEVGNMVPPETGVSLADQAEAVDFASHYQMGSMPSKWKALNAALATLRWVQGLKERGDG